MSMFIIAFPVCVGLIAGVFCFLEILDRLDSLKERHEALSKELATDWRIYVRENRTGE